MLGRGPHVGAALPPPPLGPLGFECSHHRQTLGPSSSRDPQQSPASFRSAVKDLEDPPHVPEATMIWAGVCLGTCLDSPVIPSIPNL